MLDPNDRTLLFDALRPPDGYVMDEAIGTTYSLDLVALLAAPLGFTIAEWRGNPRIEWSISDTLAVLRTLKKYVGRMSVFCDAARIAVPKQHTPLFALLEDAVVPVNAPKQGAAFHPKVWLLRFAPPSNSQLPVRYRLLVLTRNLTFDRCMDAVAVLEGESRDRMNGYSASRPIADFVRALPALAMVPVTDVVRERVERIAREVHRTEFSPGFPFDESYFEFHFFGLERESRIVFHEAKRRLIVAPFVSDDALADMVSDGKPSILISRAEQLSLLKPGTVAKFERVLVPRQELLEIEKPGDDEQQDTLPVSDLHAKLYVEEVGAHVTNILVGSANATNAAFERNVEVLLSLRGPTKFLGLATLLDKARDDNDFADLWQDYDAELAPIADPEAVALEQRLESARAMMAACTWEVRVQPATDTAQYGSELVATSGFDSATLAGFEARTWPVTLRDTQAIGLSADGSAFLPPTSIASLSAFWIVELSMSHAKAPAPARFVLRAALIGAPEHRIEAVTQSLISDRSALIRFLQLLLADDDAALLLGNNRTGKAARDASALGIEGAGPDWALLEPLLRALERDPERLDDIERILRDLQATEEGRAKIPPELDDVWAAVWAARQELVR